MSNFIKLSFVADSAVDEYTLHSLYTTIRYKNKKELNSTEKFKVWNVDRLIYIIIEESKIEEIKNIFEFNKYNGKKIKIKLIKKENHEKTNFLKGDFVSISGVISYAKKEMMNGKIIEKCPVDFKGNIKNKDELAIYLSQRTGLDFVKSIEYKDRVIFERIFKEQNEGVKVNIRNLIFINAIVEVKDEKTANELSFKSIGKKISYGLGNMFISKTNIS